MKGFQKIIISLLVVFLMIFSSVFVGVSAETKTSNRFNVVFVLDSSGSMKKNDPDGYRYDAAKMFLGLLADKGNYVGSVIFGTGVVNKSDIIAIDGIDDKEKAEKAIEVYKDKQHSAIGDGIYEGVNMLEEQGNKDLPSVMIVLTDGVMSVGEDKDALEECRVKKSKAIEKARKNGIKIFTIGLNADGTADMPDLKRIAKSTNGYCEKVERADDLKSVFAHFYNLIYSTETTEVFEGEVPNNGKIDKAFKIPRAGVEEVNIIISKTSSVVNLSLKKPDGTILGVDEVEKFKIETKSFSITKISSPEGGTWNLYAEGTPGDEIKIDMVFNDCLSLDTESDDPNSVKINDQFKVTGYMYNENEKVTDPKAYDEFKATLHMIKDTEEKEPIEMKAVGASFVGTIPITDRGTYTVYMNVVNKDALGSKGEGESKEEIQGKSTVEKPIILNVENTPPQTKRKKIEEHFWVIPGFKDNKDIDLKGAVVDSEDSKVTYSVVSTGFKDTSYKLNGETLTITDFSDLSEGSFTMRGTDSLGGYSEFEVDVTTTNVGILTLILILIIALIVIAIIVAVIILLSRKKFMGTITVQNLETGASAIQQKNKGNIKLSSFQIGNTGFSKDARFQATNKSYVEFRTSKPVLTSSTVSKSKKITIQNRCEIEIYSDDTRTKGISVVFESYLSSY